MRRLLACSICLAAIACSTDSGPDWEGFALAVDEAVVGQNVDAASLLRDSLLALRAEGSIEAAWAALELARFGREELRWDSYRLLRHAEGSLVGVTTPEADSARLELATEYGLVGLPRRAVGVLGAEGVERASELGLVRERLRIIDGTLTDAGIAPTGDPESDDLLQMLAIAPSGFFFLDPADSVADLAEPWGLGPVPDLLDPARALLATRPRFEPAAGVGSDPGGWQRVPLQASQRREIAALTAPLAVDQPLSIGFLEDPSLVRLAEIVLERPEVGSSWLPLQAKVLAGGGLAIIYTPAAAADFDDPMWSFLADRQAVLVTTPTDAGAGALSRPYDNPVSISELAALGSGSQVLFTQVLGSGGYLDATMLDVETGRTLLALSSTEKGHLTLKQLDEDAPLEVMIRGRLMVFGCNQCDGVYETTIWDYDDRTGAYHPGAWTRTVGAYIVGTYRNVAGLSPDMKMSVSEAQALMALAELRSSQNPQVVINSAEELLGEYVPLLGQANRGLDAAAIAQEIAERLAELDQTDEVRFTRLVASWTSLMGQLEGGQALEALRRLRADSWLREELERRDGLVDLFNLQTVMALTAGRTGEMLESLLEEARYGADTVSTYHGNTSLYYLRVGAWEEAYERASLALDLAVGEANVLGGLINMLHLSVAAYRAGRPEEVSDWLTRSISLAKGIGANPQLALALWAAGQYALEIGRAPLALVMLDEGLSVTLEAAFQTGGPAALVAYARALSEAGDVRSARNVIMGARAEARAKGTGLIEAAYWASRLSEGEGRSEEALALAREAFEELRSGRQALGPETDKFSLIASQEVIRTWYLRLLRQSGASAEAVYDASQEGKMQVFRDLYLEGQPDLETASLAELQSRLSPGDVLVDLNLMTEGSIATVVTSTDADLIDLAVTRDRVASLSADLDRLLDPGEPESLRDIRSRRVPEEWADVASSLYHELLDPAVEGVEATRLLIVPDEHTALLPWSALVTPSGSFLIEELEIGIVPFVSRRTLNGRRQGQDEPGNALVIVSSSGVSADRVSEALGGALTGVAGSGLAPLSFAVDEAVEVSRALGVKRTVLVGDAASRRRISSELGVTAAEPNRTLELLSEAETVHIVAHGLFNPVDAMGSVVFIDPESDRGWLSARDLLAVDLSDVELVTLSACQTGVSEIKAGGEPLGFVRSLLAAGAGSVMLTGWEVDDRATQELVTRFYREYHAASKTRALQLAQVGLITEWRHPFFWASLQMYGAWD